jgi:cytochrome P450
MSFLQIYDAAPDPDKSRLVRDWIDNDPLAFFAELRSERPIFESALATLVARFPDVIEILSHPTIFPVKLYVPKMHDFMLATDDEAAHQRDKSVMQAMLNMDDAPRIREMVGRFADEALTAAKGRVDLVGDYTRKVPIQLVGEYFGFPGPDLATMKRWSYIAQFDNFHNYPFTSFGESPEIHAQADAAKAEMKEYISQLVPRKLQQLKENPQLDDVISRILKTPFPPSVGFGVDRWGVNIVGLLVGAVETTSQAVAQAVDELLKRPIYLEQARQAAEKGDDELFAGYVWEAMRFHPIFPYLSRISTVDYTLAKGTARAKTIPAGTVVLALTWSAMFDPDELPLPDEFQPRRPYYSGLHFGYGMHRCLGEHVAMTMACELMRKLILRPNFRRAPGNDGQLDYKGGPFPERCVVEFDA